MRKALLIALVLAFGCDKKCEQENLDNPWGNRLECVVPFGPTQYDDGTPWPTYSQKLAEFEACHDGNQPITGASLNECVDGKTLLSLGGGFYFESYYFQGETLVGYESGGDFITFDCDGCASPRPQGTRDSITCDVVSTREIYCAWSPGGDASPASCQAGLPYITSAPGPDAPSSSEACDPDSTRCNGRFLQQCVDKGTQWISVEDCETPARCVGYEPGLATCVIPKCEAGQTCCDGAVRQQCNADETAYEQIETCASAALCMPDGCISPSSSDAGSDAR